MIAKAAAVARGTGTVTSLPVDPVARQIIRSAARARQEEPGDPVRRAAPNAPNAPDAHAETAARIMAAARKARGLEPVEKPPEGTLARRIVDSAARARGELK